MNETLGTKTNEKTIFAIRGVKDTGKTQTIRKIHRLLEKAYPPAKVTWVYPKEDPLNSPQDICLFMEIDGVWIGIESQGDPSCRLPESLEMFAKHQPPCAVILCATRTRGGTVWAVDGLEHAYGYKAVWIEKEDYQKDSKDNDQENAECANHIFTQIVHLLPQKPAH